MNLNVVLKNGSGAFFMVEQQALLKNFHEEDNKVLKPILDEQEMEQLGFLIMESLHYTLPIQITSWVDGYFEQIVGTVNKVDHLTKYIEIDKTEYKMRINIDNISNVKKV
ncbi:YolD-like family protein [Cytobacillus purgationiresistens]|uniref:YolD-like family protein n=1 Tax=Cytobacillus purgationiresistens TaxID=863449 RepID=A0ABU0AQF5_9BACI|nr:YolD-like family protein [Cytobacillus purgationiresistens]MDQ0273482.1 hypothetical protein [Cytobacillus purgationiresistens]